MVKHVQTIRKAQLESILHVEFQQTAGFRFAGLLGVSFLGRTRGLFFPKLSTGMEFGTPAVVCDTHLSDTEMVGNYFTLALFEAGDCFIDSYFSDQPAD